MKPTTNRFARIAITVFTLGALAFTSLGTKAQDPPTGNIPPGNDPILQMAPDLDWPGVVSLSYIFRGSAAYHKDRMWVRVDNIGGSDANPSVLRVGDQIGTHSNGQPVMQYAYFTIPKIEPGQSAWILVKFPDGRKVVGEWLEYIIDQFNAVHESDESNNSSWALKPDHP